MASGLKPSTLELLKRFNRAFPQFYEQFVSSEIQLQNLKLACRLSKTRQAVIEIRAEGNEGPLHFITEPVFSIERYFWSSSGNTG